MFSLASVPAVPYEDPWQAPLAERLRSLAKGRRRVAYWYEMPNNSSFRYRAYNMVQALHAHDGGADVSASWFFHADLERVDEIAGLADVLVICRSRYDSRTARLVGAFRRLGRRVLFDVDDFVFNPDYTHLLVKSLDLDVQNPQVWDDWFAYTSRLGATFRLCDGGIATNEFLARKMSDFAGVPAEVVPNFMNREQLAVSQQVLEAKRSQRPGADGLIHLGYFSGSPSHNRDFALVAPALEELLASDPRLGIAVVGYIEAGPGLERFGARVKRFPFHDFVNLQRVIGSVEFNLMPLQFNTFTNSKSELKYFEAAAVGTPSIASPSTVYAAAIRHGETGWLAQSHRWEAVVREALAALEDYDALVQRAHDDAMRRYTYLAMRETILRALGLDA
ncbi:glycosyltransferase [Ramlibacter sp.]|uniref:glycosyltransferase n=1 Tax=Ramlibacter sp. TaxID=1917967 RepID=UPI003D11FB18